MQTYFQFFILALCKFKYVQKTDITRLFGFIVSLMDCGQLNFPVYFLAPVLLQFLFRFVFSLRTGKSHKFEGSQCHEQQA